MCGKAAMLSNTRPHYATVLLPDRSTIAVTSIGIMRIRLFCQIAKRHYTIPLLDTLHVPGLNAPLMAVIPFAMASHRISFLDSCVKLLLNTNETLPLRIRISHPYYHPTVTTTSLAICRHNSHPAANTVNSRSNTMSIIPTANHVSNQTITLERMHQRLGHVSMRTIIAGWEAGVWDKFKLQFEPDTFCIGCQVGAQRTANRGSGTVSNPTLAGQIIHLDILYNPSETGLTKASYFPYYLGIANAYLHAFFMIGLRTQDVTSITSALTYFVRYYKPTQNYTITDIKEIHADAGSVFHSKLFIEKLQSIFCPAVIRVAAPQCNFPTLVQHSLFPIQQIPQNHGLPIHLCRLTMNLLHPSYQNSIS
jgi:hypothetical protein